jgi:hypothetical protein
LLNPAGGDERPFEGIGELALRGALDPVVPLRHDPTGVGALAGALVDGRLLLSVHATDPANAARQLGKHRWGLAGNLS